MCNMKFGKLGKIDGVDFTMPATPTTTTKILTNLASNKTQPLVYSGCTGWSMKEWQGSFYPQNAKSQDFLRHYARQFNTIELNSTYYRIPDKKTVDRWVEQTGSGFLGYNDDSASPQTQENKALEPKEPVVPLMA